MKKYSILTFNFGNYEIFRDPEEVDTNCEYVYVTDNPNFKSKIWKVIVDKKNKDKSPYFKSFYVRYHPFEYISTKTCIVIDSSIKIKKSLSNIIYDFNKFHYDIGLLLMPFCNNKPYEEINIWRNKLCRLSKVQTNLLYNFYHYYQMEDYRGGIDAGFKIVKNTKQIKELHENVWQHILFLKGDKDICRLDQVILSIILYKFFNTLNVMLFSRKWICSDYLKYCKHGTNTENLLNNINFNNQYFFNQPANFYY